jgi:hypothetical protein
MDRVRSRYGVLLAALGAMLLAVSVFLPWYGVTLHSASGSPVAALARQPAALSAQQAFEYLSVALLVLAAIALLDALLALPGDAPASGAGASLALLGAVAGACVAYHVIQPPQPSGSVGPPALREGVWLALFGSLLMLAGGLWPRTAASRVAAGRALGGLRGPTPQS